MNSLTRFQRIIGFSVFIALIIGLTVFILSGTRPQLTTHNAKPQPKADRSLVDSTPPLQKELPVVLHINQYPPGNRIIASEVYLDQPGYVVISEEPTKIVGYSALLPAGRSENVPVPLRRTIRVDESFTAMLYADDGNGTFEPAGSDQPILQEGGTYVTTSFTIEEE